MSMLPFLIAGLLSVGDLPGDPLCERLLAFEAEAVAPSALIENWIDLKWVPTSDPDIMWGRTVVCHHSDGDAANSLCRYLISGGGSIEFPESIPMRILECHGHRFGPGEWSNWKATIELHEGDSLQRLAIDLESASGHIPQIRYTAFSPSATFEQQFPEWR